MILYRRQCKKLSWKTWRALESIWNLKVHSGRNKFENPYCGRSHNRSDFNCQKRLIIMIKGRDVWYLYFRIFDKNYYKRANNAICNGKNNRIIFDRWQPLRALEKTLGAAWRTAESFVQKIFITAEACAEQMIARKEIARNTNGTRRRTTW